MSTDSTDSTDARDFDALDALRLPTSAESPSPEFAARLRRRLEEIIMPTPPATTADTIAARQRSLTPYLVVADARAAIEWYREVLGARLQGEPIVMDDDRIGHCELAFGDSVLFLADEFPEMDILGPASRGGDTTMFTLLVADADATVALAAARGATIVRPVADQFYDERAGQIRDPFGQRWSIGTPIAARAAEIAHEAQPFRASDLWDEVGYYTIAVPDPSRARRFYRGLFGWEMPEPEASPDGHVGMHNPSTKIPMGFHDGALGTGATLYFRVRDMRAVAERVRELGGEVLELNDWPSGGNAHCRDDQGVEFDLWQPAEGY
jgi:uncharacterized glyoxalase superfamily protein PhnB